MLTEALIIAFFVIGIQLMVPIVFAALGEAVVEKSGVLNVGIEGVMLIGAFATAFIGITRQSIVLSMATAVAVGALFGALLAYLYVSRGTDQIVTGLMFNIFAVGLTGTLHARYLAGQNGVTLQGINLPGVESIPWVGEIMGKQNAMLYLALALAVGVWFLLNRTWYGLYARSAGERPMAAESGGLDVRRLRYPAVIIGCALAALGGSALVLSTSGGFVPGMTAGRGFIAMGVVVLAKWRPRWIFIHALGFGLTQALQFLAGQVPTLADIPKQFWVALPYMVTVLAVVFAPGSRYPAAVGIPYRPAGKAA
jgi:general nucleoside transport system permease protein